MTRPVLILGAEARVAVPAARCLHRHGIPVLVAALSPAEPTLVSRHIREFLRLPSPQQEPEAFVAALVALVARAEADLLIPSSDTALAALTRHHARLVDEFERRAPGVVQLGCPAPAAVEQVLDKAATLAVAARCGIPVPRTYRISTLEELDGLRDTLRFPVAVKPASKTRTSSTKVRYFDSMARFAQAVRSEGVAVSHMLIQEYCPGVGVGVEVLLQGTEPVAIFQHRRLKEYPASGGVSVVAVSEPVDPQLSSWALQLLRALEWSGVAMVEFRYDPERRQAVLMEINGRYWGSLSLSVAAGLEFPFYEWQLAHGERPAVPEYRVGVRVRWTRGAFLRLQERLREEGGSRASVVLEEVRDFFPPTLDALWSLRDPVPALRELSMTSGAWFRAGVRRVARRLLPRGLQELGSAYRLLGPRDGRIYVARSLARQAGLLRDSWERLPAQIGRVLVVCHGNIIRSPMAAALLRRGLDVSRPEIDVVSAGLHAKPYTPADPRAARVAEQLGCSLAEHQAQMLTSELVDGADVIFVMDRLNEAKLLGRFPHARGKVWLLGGCENAADPDIRDPYGGDLEEVRRCYERVARAVRRAVSILTTAEAADTRPEVAPDRPGAAAGTSGHA